MPGLHATTGPFLLEPATLQIPGRAPKKIIRSFMLYGKGEKEGLNGEIYRMIYVKINFTPTLLHKRAEYRVALELRARKEISSQFQTS